jgi:hypothetical protein
MEFCSIGSAYHTGKGFRHRELVIAERRILSLLQHENQKIGRTVKSIADRTFRGSNSCPRSIFGGGVAYDRRQTVTCSTPCFSTVSFLSSPWSAPYILSFNRQS